MISQSFLIVFLLSIVLNVLHGIECIKTKFWDIEPHIYFYTKYFKSIPQAIYFEKHINLYFSLFMIFSLLLGGKWMFIPFLLYGTIFITEFHHFLKAVKHRKYYSGAITSFFFPILGIFYFLELIKLWN